MAETPQGQDTLARETAYEYTPIMSTPNDPFLSSAPDANDGLYDPLEVEFNRWIEEDQHINNSRLSAYQYREYRHWCQHPDAPAKGQKESNNKNKAKKFEWIDGKLFRRSMSTKTENFDSRQVIQADRAWRIIKNVHKRLSHAKVQNTFKEVQRRYFGITREEVEWVIRHCPECLLESLPSTRPPLKSIVTNNPLDRVEGDLTDWRSEPSGPFKWLLQLVVFIL